MKSYSYTELDQLAGEVLPERAVLSTLLAGGGDGGGAIVVPNCATNVVNQSGSLGQLLLAGPNTTTVACSGATVAAGG
ncbi:hypothetical protein [Actinomadura formosensis]|uniref:hypothetical protein n=1 Tax=Actinomadura formosensis TaxID=60706 RepID=UPI0008342854|nr:hypothetical protein [Actinomadura formosensis]